MHNKWLLDNLKFGIMFPDKRPFVALSCWPNKEATKADSVLIALPFSKCNSSFHGMCVWDLRKTE